MQRAFASRVVSVKFRTFWLDGSDLLSLDCLGLPKPDSILLFREEFHDTVGNRCGDHFAGSAEQQVGSANKLFIQHTAGWVFNRESTC